jgi:uncharacterized protein
MRTLFVDAVYWITLLNPKDSLHERSVILSRSLGPCLLVTTEGSDRGSELLRGTGQGPRRAAAESVRRLRKDANTRIIPQTSAQFDDAYQVYRDRDDKSWSHTDCASFRVMADEQITR